jgi:TatD DNase family protein
MHTGNPLINIHTHHITSTENISVLNIQAGEKLPENISGHVYFSIGIHPWYSEQWQDKAGILNKLAINNRVIAIGECGLDKNTTTPMALQEEIFLKHISLSETLRKPIIIHCVKAFGELFRIRKDTKPRMPWIIHGFNRSMELGLQCIEQGFLLSFGKALLNDTPQNTALMKQLSPDQFFFETDNSGLEISLVYKKCATLKNIPVEQLQNEISRNFSRYFNFDLSNQ